MNHRMLQSTGLGCAVACAMVIGCGAQRSSDTAHVVNGVFAVQIQAAKPADLPICNSKTGGETAMVTATSTLESCIGGSWVPIPCTSLIGGAVAYDSTTKTLWACTQGTASTSPSWTPITIPQGPPGATGGVGPTGTPGQTGDAGAVSLVLQVPEAAGPNCVQGGTKVESGIDVNHDGQLELSEVTSTGYVCNGANGSAGMPGSLVSVTNEPLGAHCARGGQRIDIGVDANSDGLLESAEVQQTAYVCNPATDTSTADAGASGGAAGSGGSMAGGGGSTNGIGGSAGSSGSTGGAGGPTGGSPGDAGGSTGSLTRFCGVGLGIGGAPNDLQYYGGPVVSNASVVVVYWDASVNARTVSLAGKLFKSMLSTYANELAQYSTSQTIGIGSYFGSFTLAGSSPAKIDDTAIQTRLAMSIASGELPKPQLDSQGRANTVYMVFFPSTTTVTVSGLTSCVDYCSYHSDVLINGVAVPFAAIPDTSVGPCANGCDPTLRNGSQELINVITDPDSGEASGPQAPLAWYSYKLGDVGDICWAASPASDLAPLWSRADHDCMLPCAQ